MRRTSGRGDTRDERLGALDEWVSLELLGRGRDDLLDIQGARVTPDPSTEPIATDEDYDAWLRLFANRNEVAEAYAQAMRANGVTWDGYARINQAILRRWSMAGLRYIKDRAWKIATQNL